MKISFQTALITGSSRGIGRRIAVKLAQEGVKKIAIHYLNNKDEAERTVSLVRDAGAEGILVQGDTSDPIRAEEIVHEAALDSTCRYFAVALGRHGITVNSVSPGCCDETTAVGQIPQEMQDALKNWAEAGWTPMRRRGTPDDIANVCALLCSEEAGFVTGQTISVDGGSSQMNPDFPLALQVPS